MHGDAELGCRQRRCECRPDQQQCFGHGSCHGGGSGQCDQAGFTATVSSVTTAQAVTLTASAGGVSKTFALQLNAAVPTLTMSPASLAFGNVTVNTASTLPVTLTSTGTAPVTINSAALSGTGFTMSGATFPVTLNPTQSATVNVQFDPATAGAATGQLTVQSNSSTNGTAVISLTGTGTAVAGSIECAVLQQRVHDGGGERYVHSDAELRLPGAAV